MKISLAKSTSNGFCQVRFMFQGKNGVETQKSAPEAISNLVSNFSTDGSYKGAFGETAMFRDGNNDSQLLVGLGDGATLSLESIRQIGAKIYKKLKADKVGNASVYVDDLPKALATPDIVQTLAESFHLSAYTFDDFKTEKSADDMNVQFCSRSSSSKMKTALSHGETLASCQNFSRWLGDCPGNFMTPTRLADETTKAAKGTGLKVTKWNKDKIAKEKMDSLIGVSNGSVEEPRFIIMEYNGAAKSKKPVCFVGKGLTFDAGGISLKPGAGMEEMKYDMCGGANVIGAVLAIAKLKLKVNVIAFVPASENMPGPAANKPGDIRAARNGVTIEINNTDAEGRLILADALSYASEKKPAWIVDAATLTGAMMVALGRTHTGFYSRHPKMANLVQRASEATGELVWQMPLTDAHTKDMKGTYADLNNIGPHRFAGSAQAAAFLEHFVAEGIPWVHCDIAGTAWHCGSYYPYHPAKGATGSMVRTFVEMARLHR